VQFFATCNLAIFLVVIFWAMIFVIWWNVCHCLQFCGTILAKIRKYNFSDKWPQKKERQKHDKKITPNKWQAKIWLKLKKWQKHDKQSGRDKKREKAKQQAKLK
jgi:hypothetical protein